MLKLIEFFEAVRLFKEMPEKNVISWNIMIDGHVQNDRIEKALGVVRKDGREECGLLEHSDCMVGKLWEDEGCKGPFLSNGSKGCNFLDYYDFRIG